MIENITDETLNNVLIAAEEMESLAVTLEPNHIEMLLPGKRAAFDFTVSAIRMPLSKNEYIDFELYVTADEGIREKLSCNAVIEPSTMLWRIVVFGLSFCLAAVFVLVYVRQSRRMV